MTHFVHKHFWTLICFIEFKFFLGTEHFWRTQATLGDWNLIELNLIEMEMED